MNLEKKQLTEQEKYLINLKPSDKELLARENFLKIRDFYKTQISFKKTLIELIKFNYKPLCIKIIFLIIILKNRNKYKYIKFGYVSGYRFSHIEKFFKEDIRVIYEFGSGGSTIHIAQLLKDQFIKKGIKGKLYTFEQSKKWMNQLKNNFPIDLKEYVEFSYKDLVYYIEDNFRLLKYNINDYHDNIDLVYIDGPTHQLFKNLPKGNIFQANGNIVEMIKLNKFKKAFSDHRFYYYYVYKNFMNDNYSIKIDLLNRSILIKKNI